MTNTYRSMLELAANQLSRTSDTARLDSELLLQHTTNKSLAWLIAHDDDTPSEKEATEFEQACERRTSGEPIAYITGRKSFWTLDLEVSPDVLIPRPETELLVELALRKLNTDQSTTVLDLGTGSGCIALALGKEHPASTILAVEYHQNALSLAIKNAKTNLLDNVQFLFSDWYSRVPTAIKFDLIVSNPPYIDRADPHLEKDGLSFEPKTALISQQNGMADLEHIISTAPGYLNNLGWLLVEHGYDQAEFVVTLFNDYSFVNVATHKDLNNIPRVTLGQILT